MRGGRLGKEIEKKKEERERKAVGEIKRGKLGRERERLGDRERWGQTEGNLRDLACTREEQTGTQLSEEARREQNNSSSLSLSLQLLPSFLLSISPVPLASAKKRSSARQPYTTWWPEAQQREGGKDTEVNSQRVKQEWRGQGVNVLLIMTCSQNNWHNVYSLRRRQWHVKSKQNFGTNLTYFDHFAVSLLN